MKIKSLLLTPMLYQPRKTFVHLQNTNEDIFDWLYHCYIGTLRD